ncbi:ABC transporter substrate-binding protein [Paenibacillus sp. J5C_2022]|uniref:ABC transporter substrate-binding protein n=1 Tax=Paenibacillus sp. J5C2022 TaxID=2977129 RepID=UPI0021D2EECF|nr:ABC transporter substrate-binding protein [Paenibacillus sp. J5C2022]MCU6707905.1 ABC transporter substrate-binding protein [Paenibacillus sp. J5C2022]
MSRYRLKKYFIGCLLLAVFVLLAACGNNANSTAPDPPPAPTHAADSGKASNEPAEATEEDTITYTAANGEVVVPKNPQRIVVDSKVYVGYFLALGIKPAGVPEEALHVPYFEGQLDGVESIGDMDSSLEQITALDPDLIITITRSKNIENFEKIAPTIAIEYGTKDYREQLLDFGKITGKEAEAQAWIDSWDAKIAEHKPMIEEAVGDGTVSILQPHAKGIYAFGHNYGRGGEILYGEFKLKAPEVIQQEAIDSGAGYANISLEKLPEFAGDIIFTSPWTGDEANPDYVYESTLWKSLPAVKNGKVYNLDSKYSNYSDPVSLEAHLDFIVKSLTP